MRIIFISFLIFLISHLNAQHLAFNLVEKSLVDDVNVVIRNSTKEFEVIHKGKAIETNRIELTILNETGKREAEQYVFYSDLSKVISVSGEIYDKYGKRVKKIKNSNNRDVSTGGSNMYSDNRAIIVDFSYPSYPYSIIFNYKIQHDGLMFYPSWAPQDHPKTAVEKASFKITVPISLGVNYFEHLVEGNSSTENGMLTHSWNVEHVTGFKTEPYGPARREYSPYVLTTPKEFEMEGYAGSMSTWKSIGEYENKLLEGKRKLPLGAIQALEKEIDGVVSNREKAKKIYEFVQNTTRYVSVQLGIGGWQPYDPTYVFENGYGDCKALTNYTHALLSHAEIPSIYTNVYAGQGKPDINTSFPNTRFNHVILAVPFEQDTVWLECTSQNNPFGYTGYFTSDRHALLITDEGGKLVKTPTYTKEENTQIRVVDVEITKNGNAIATITTEYAGLQYENADRQLYESRDEQKKWLMKKIDLEKTTITDFSYEHQPGIVPKITEKLEVTSKGFGSVTGTRIFFEVNPLNQLSRIPKKIKERKTDVHIRTAYTDIDSIHFKLPEGYHVEYLPESTHLKTQFGEYKTTYKIAEDGLLYIRKLISEKGVFPAESYEDHRTMLKKISKSDKAQIVLVGST